MKRTIALFALVGTCLSGVALADGHYKGNDHQMNLFLGGSSLSSSGGGSTSAFTLGLNYEYRTPWWDNRVGLGLILDFGLFDGSTLTNVLVGFWAHVWCGLKVVLAPGMAFANSNSDFAFRIGAAYDWFFIEDWSLAPTVNWETIDGGTDWIYGLNVGYSF